MKTASNSIEIVGGEIYNSWTIVKEVEPYVSKCGQRHRKVEAKCSCGKVRQVLLTSIKTGKSRSCGHERSKTLQIESGSQYNYWKVIKEVESKQSLSRMIQAECICGKIKNINFNSLLRGTSKSCGCKRDYTCQTGTRTTVDTPIKDRDLNLEYESWKVVELISAERNEKLEVIRTVKFQCKCGKTKIGDLRDLKSSKSCAHCANKNKKRKPKYTEEQKAIMVKMYYMLGAMKKNKKVETEFTLSELYSWAIEKGFDLKRKWRVRRKDFKLNYNKDNCVLYELKLETSL